MLSIDSMVGFYESFGYLSVFGVLLLCGFGLPIPEDISLIAGGIISGLGVTNVHIMVLVGYAGVMLGDSIIYNLGRIFGKKVFDKKIVGKSSGQWYDRILKSFNKNGKWVLFAARFLPGLRTPIFLTAGITHFVRFSTFFIIDSIAALISVPVWVYLGYVGASNREQLLFWMKNTRIGFIILVVILIIVWLISRSFKKKLEKAEIVGDDESAPNGGK
ncbi:MAG: DedA family protein [Spirochaetota bacterium]